MTLQDLSVLRGHEHGAPGSNGRRAAGSRGAAHARARDAYRDVPLLRQPTWNHEIAAYFFFGGISSGAFVLGTLAELFGGKKRQRLGRTAHYVAFAALLPCPWLLIDDLGKPLRFHHMLRIVKPSSPMNLGAWALTAHGFFSTLLFARLLARRVTLPLVGALLADLPEGPITATGLPAALTLGGYTGVLLGTTSVPVWYTSPLLGALFMASSLSTGAAATTLVSSAIGPYEPLEEQSLAPLNVTLGAAELAVLGGYVATSGRAAKPLFTGTTGILMAGAALSVSASVGFEVLAMASRKHGRLFSLLASGATLLGGGLLRWGVVRAGQVSAADREGTLEAMSPSPSAPGWGPGAASV